MIQEQIYDVASWWKDQSFPCKEYFNVDEEGVFWLKTPHIKERQIGHVTLETADVVLKHLQEKFAGLEMKVRDFETEWIAAEDKLKYAEKVHHMRDMVLQTSAVGDFEALMVLITEWENSIKNLIDANYDIKLKMVEQAEALQDSTQWKEATQAYKELGEKWKQTGYLDKGRNEALFARMEAAKKIFYDRKKEHNNEEEIEMMQNLDLKIEIIEKAEKLAQSEEWKATTEAFHKLMDEWKAVGRTIHKKNEELWQRFITAKNVFFERKSKHFEQIKKEQESNYIVKLALVLRAEALQDSTDWHNTPQAYAAIMDEWKKSGRLSAEKSEELWKRLTAAQDIFFEAKKKVSEETKQLFQNNYNIKSELLKRAVAIKNSSNWGAATEEMNHLMEEWKKSGPVARAQGNKMWDAFLEARKHFFARKDADREDRKQFAESQKAHRAAHEQQQKQDLLIKIKDEEDRLADFRNGLQNITPGKKSEELRLHLENLIRETEEGLVKLRKKAGIAQDTVDS